MLPIGCAVMIVTQNLDNFRKKMIFCQETAFMAQYSAFFYAPFFWSMRPAPPCEPAYCPISAWGGHFYNIESSWKLTNWFKGGVYWDHLQSKHLRGRLGPRVRHVMFFGSKEVGWSPIEVCPLDCILAPRSCPVFIKTRWKVVSTHIEVEVTLPPPRA